MLPVSIASDMCWPSTLGSIEPASKPRMGSGKTGLSMKTRRRRIASPSALSGGATPLSGTRRSIASMVWPTSMSGQEPRAKWYGLPRVVSPASAPRSALAAA